MQNNTIIFGDSYCTFKGFIPKGYLPYYTERKCYKTDVTDVSQTWWYQVFNEANLNLVLNDSWSTSTIGYTGYYDMDCSASSSFIYRLKKLIEAGFFQENEIHKAFVFGGTNDSWSNAPLGKPDHRNWEHEDLYEVLPAIDYFLHLLKQTIPHAEIYCLVNTGLKPEITNWMLQVCERYGIVPIVFDHIDKKCGHPTIQGMLDIKHGVLKALK